MTPTFWISAVGLDRPGLVAELTGALADLGANIEDAAMSRFRDWFAIMLLVTGDASLDQALSAGEWPEDLVLTVRPVVAGESTAPAAATHRLSVYGADRPGIVAEATRLLAERGFNIIDLEVEVMRRDDEALFVMVLDFAADDDPTGIDAALSERIGLDVHLVALDAVAL
ncbi:MAG: ACT domain-containing protein [Candidatus Dadabacteria bacterium]|nr:MAG: ACT domain-containing protein [Candidatus Dadabacteria bacterium]